MKSKEFSVILKIPDAPDETINETLQQQWQEIVTQIVAADYESSCQGKVKYGHQETADRATEAMTRRYGGKLSSYKCRHCDGWHIGH